MRFSTALLLNLFVYPGAGHFYLKKKGWGWFWVLMTSVFLMGLIVVFEMELLHHLKPSEPLGLDPFWQGILMALKTKKEPLLLLLFGLGCCWIGSALDGIRLFKQSQNLKNL